MSLFDLTSIHCPACGTSSDFQAAGSVNADRRPDLRQEILDDTFQTVTCTSCGEVMRLEPVVNYLDVEFGLWLAVYPPRQIGDYQALEETVQGLFNDSYGDAASPSAQEVGAILKPRLTFGWPATREKILLATKGLDDVAIEMLKLDLLRRLPRAPLRAGVELRVVDVTEDSLQMIWVETASENVLESFEANIQLLKAITDDPEPWAEIRESLTGGVFVDIQKLYLGAGRDAA
ncbi:CpXC domain containing protein [Sulfitobacter noctilucicola]|uniref:CpXC domain-containing protein n=1 Tax=Sulfitobacter noctilucicola TaxID=1342301 RepID=A0A7W6MBH5_9RHOB|nr:CpXC domain-containing protein [Sulfitobacter noctilucicola]KIN70009.1 CpXC domain containing protein [Sulfitobacter noctilucicola]MBB4176021.1 hypothetical protein [Sulfitobacter noctilucicola]